MYITINVIIGTKIINLSYSIQGKEIAVVSMLSDNVQYWLKGPIKVLLKTGEEIVLNKGAYTNRELSLLIGAELKSQMLDSRNDVLRTNKLEKVTKMTISLNEIDNSDNLEDGQPRNIYLHITLLLLNTLLVLSQSHLSIRNLKIVRFSP